MTTPAGATPGAPEAVPFWEGCGRGELRLQRCRSCGAFQFFPRSRCRRCLAEELEWVPASGRGRLVTFSTVHRAPSPEFAAEVPYTLGLVQLEEDVPMMARILAAEEDLTIDAPVRAQFVRSPLGQPVPAFVPAGEDGDAA